MTLSSVILRLLICRGRGAKRAGLVFRADKVRGTPTAFPFRAGIARRAPGQVRFRSAGLLFNCQVAGSRGCVCGLELNVNICPGQDGTLRPFGRREDWEGFHANARNGEGREGFVGERSGAMVTVDL